MGNGGVGRGEEEGKVEGKRRTDQEQGEVASLAQGLGVDEMAMKILRLLSMLGETGFGFIEVRWMYDVMFASKSTVTFKTCVELSGCVVAFMLSTVRANAKL